MILNENFTRTMPSLRSTVDKKKNDTKESKSIFSMFQNAFIGNVAIYIYGGRNDLV
jgi:hypothetical protein